MFNVETNNDGTIWITCPEPFEKNINRVASIIRNDKADVWEIDISKGSIHIWFSIVISPENTKENIIELTKKIMMFSQAGINFQ